MAVSIVVVGDVGLLYCQVVCEVSVVSAQVQHVSAHVFFISDCQCITYMYRNIGSHRGHCCCQLPTVWSWVRVSIVSTHQFFVSK